MLQVPQQQYVQFLYENEDWSVSDIAKHVGIHWPTADKYASRDDWIENLRKRKRVHTVVGLYIDVAECVVVGG